MTKTIVLTTGGSGGHIFPAQSVAAELLKRGHKVIFITDHRGSVFQNLPEVQTYHLLAESVTGRSILGKAIAALKLWLGAGQAMKLLFKLKPDLVIGFGGYASIPTVISAEMMHIPVILHEQNAILGRANRILAKGARLIATSFPTVARIPSKVPSIHVGQPVRSALLEKANSPYPENSDFNLLVFGGSQGARFLSKQFPDVLMKLPAEDRAQITLIQQARPEDEEALRETYKDANFKSLTIQSFFQNMPELLENANLVVGRGGAGTLTEVMVVGRPAFIVPLPSAADDHQTANAKVLEDAGGAWVVQERNFDADQLCEKIKTFIHDPSVLADAAQKANKLAIVNAAERMANIAEDVMKGIQNDS